MIDNERLYSTFQPNIIMIMMDATRADRLSCYGYPRSTTPHIDKISEQSILYEQAFSPDVWTLPVATSIFTGLMPHEHGVDFDNPRLPDEITTLAERLSRNGYETWGISPGVWIGPSTNLSRGFSRFLEPHRLIKTRKLPHLVEPINRIYTKYFFKRSDKGADRINQAAIKWLTMERSNPSAPFFMFLHYMEPHYPYRPPTPFYERFLEDRAAVREAQAIKYHPLDFLAGKLSLSARQVSLLNDLYDGELAHLDSKIGELYSKLESHQFLENTVIILFADHGESLGEHGLFDHHFALYDTLIRVPLIVRLPVVSSGGTRISELVQTNELHSFVLKIASIRGQSSSKLAPLRGEDSIGYVLSETPGAFVESTRRRHPAADLDHFARNIYSVRTSKYKYIEGSDGSVEFYDLQRDPDEKVNLATAMANSAEMKRLRELLHRDLPVSVPNKRPTSDLSDDDPVFVERLRSLGYLD